jgi:small subunit ribosomal protein S17
MVSSEEKKVKRTLVGEVVSDKMNKTIVVKTVRTVRHAQFGKILKKSKKYQVHDEHEIANIGDVVEIYEGRPVSKMKHMYLSKVLKKRSLGA